MDPHPITFRTIHVIGDSHAMGFKAKGLALPDYNINVIANAMHVRGLSVHNFIQNNSLHPGIVEYFRKHGFVSSVNPDGDKPQLALEQYTTGWGFSSPLILFHVGEIYLRLFLGTIYDQPNYDLNHAVNAFKGMIGNYCAGAQFVKNFFNAYVFLHEIPPPTYDDELFADGNKFRCSAELRSTIFRIFNQLLRQYAAAHQLMFCQSNDYLADNSGCIKPEYHLDGSHADPKFADISLQRIVSTWLDSRAREFSWRYGKWQALVSKKNGLPPSRLSLSPAFHPFSPEHIRDLRAALGPLNDAVCDTPAMDWAHTSPTATPRPDATEHYADVNEGGLRILHDVLLSGDVSAQLETIVGGQFSAVNCKTINGRAMRSNVFETEVPYQQGCPPAIYKAVLYLDDVDQENGPLEFVPTEGGVPTTVCGAAGTLVLFSPNAGKYRLMAPRKQDRLLLELTLLVHPDTCPRFAFSKASFTWPTDPYMFTVDAGACYPKLDRDRWFFPNLIILWGLPGDVKKLPLEHVMGPG